jgi:DNA-binding NarL/FixJ family response regulator
MNDLATVRILVVDAQKLVAEGLEQYMAVVPKIDIVGHAFNGEDLLSRLTDLQVDLLMMDVSLRRWTASTPCACCTRRAGVESIGLLCAQRDRIRQ